MRPAICNMLKLPSIDCPCGGRFGRRPLVGIATLKRDHKVRSGGMQSHARGRLRAAGAKRGAA
jgi:hypothetical protein